MKNQGPKSGGHESAAARLDRQPSQTSPSHLQKFVGPALILLAAAVATAPQLIRGNSCGHDFNVHLVSWLDCVNAWHHRILYPHWAPSPNYGAGEPRFVFYPPLTWMLGAVLGSILPWSLAPIAFTFLCLAATGLATRALALEVLDELPATLAGCAALFSGFALFTAYERSAFPEFTGGVWLPLLLLFVLRDRHSSAPLLRRALDGSTAPLALMLACAWLSNLPLGVIAGYLLAAVALLAAVVNKSWAPVLRAGLATVLGLGLAGAYWLPAAFERHWVDIKQATEDPGYNFENNWLFSHHANPVLAFHDVVLHRASVISISMIAIAFAAIVICRLRGTMPIQKNTGSRRWWIPLAAIPIVVLFLLFPISRPLWNLLPEMPFLQYPWRWLEAVEAPMAIFLVAAIWPAARRLRIAVVAACVAWFLWSTWIAGTAFFQVCYPEDTVASTLSSHRTGAGFEGMFEYAPYNSDLTIIARGLPDACLVSDPLTVLGKPDPDDPDANPIWAPNQAGCLHTFAASQDSASGPENRRFHISLDQPGYLVLRLLRYPGWSLRLNGEFIETFPQRDDGLIAVPVSQGHMNLIVDWMTTPDVIAGRWLSLVSAFLFAALRLLELKLKGRRLT